MCRVIFLSKISSSQFDSPGTTVQTQNADRSFCAQHTKKSCAERITNIYSVYQSPSFGSVCKKTETPETSSFTLTLRVSATHVCKMVHRLLFPEMQSGSVAQPSHEQRKVDAANSFASMLQCNDKTKESADREGVNVEVVGSSCRGRADS